jgi:hypothetical protein
MARVKWEASEPDGTIEVADKDIKRAYEEGGKDAVLNLLQYEMDAYVNGNVVAVADMDHVDRALADVGLS